MKKEGMVSRFPLAGRVVNALLECMDIQLSEGEKVTDLSMEINGLKAPDPEKIANAISWCMDQGIFPFLLPKDLKKLEIITDRVYDKKGVVYHLVKIFWPKGLKSVKEQTYVSLLFSKALEVFHVSTEQPLEILEDGNITASTLDRVIGICCNSAAKMGFSPKEVLAYQDYLREQTSKVDSFKKLTELLNDGFNPLKGVNGVQQIRAIAMRTGGTTLAKGTAGEVHIFTDIYRICDRPVKEFAVTCSNVKVRRDEGRHIRTMVVRSDNPPDADMGGKNATLHVQCVRLLAPWAQVELGISSKWFDRLMDFVAGINECDLERLHDVMKVNDVTTGYGAMLYPGLLKTRFAPVILAALANRLRRATSGVKVHGASRLAIPHPGLVPYISYWNYSGKRKPITIGGEQVACTPILVPRKDGISIGTVVLIMRNPPLLIGSLVPAIVVGYTDDHVASDGNSPLGVMVSPFVFRDNMEGDFDGDTIVVFRLKLSGKLLAYLSSLSTRAFKLYRHGKVEDIVKLVPRDEEISFKSMRDMAMDAASCPVEMCDPLVNAFAELANAQGLSDEKKLNTLPSLMLVGKAIDQYKKGLPSEWKGDKLTPAFVEKELCKHLRGIDELPKPLPWNSIRGKSAVRSGKKSLSELDSVELCSQDVQSGQLITVMKKYGRTREHGHLRMFAHNSIDEPTNKLHHGEVASVAAMIANLLWVSKSFYLDKVLRVPCNETVVGHIARIFRKLRSSNLFDTRGELSVFDAATGILRDGGCDVAKDVEDIMDKHLQARRREEDGERISCADIQEKLDALLSKPISIATCIGIVAECTGYHGKEGMFVKQIECLQDLVPSLVWEMISNRLSSADYCPPEEELTAQITLRRQEDLGGNDDE